jgi:glycosyltransferase involved in cell wall biosynthesis
MSAAVHTDGTPASMSATNGLPEIAYVIKAFPRTSETFIANEIFLLEALGLNLTIFSIKRLENQKLHGALSHIRGHVTYLPEAEPVNEKPFIVWLAATLPRFAGSHWKLFRRRPASYLRTFLETLRMSWRYRETRFSLPRKVFVKEFLQAGYIAWEVLEQGSIRHLHAHFCHGATTVTMFASGLCGVPFSFTAHAKDLYLKQLNPGDLLPIKLERARFAVTCTGANQAYLETVRPQNGVHRIYHGLDLSLFSPRTSTASVGVPLILSVGRFVEKKGFHYLVEACALLRSRGFQFTCEIVGGHDVYFEPIERRIRELRLEDVVKLRSAVTQEQLKGIYEKATVFALPCLVTANGDRDGIPNVLVEAMAMQIPVVSTDISGIPELVDAGVNGVLIPEKDAPMLAAALASLLENPDLRERLGHEARRKVSRLFDARRNTIELRDLFLFSLKKPRVEK